MVSVLKSILLNSSHFSASSRVVIDPIQWRGFFYLREDNSPLRLIAVVLKSFGRSCRQTALGELEGLNCPWKFIIIWDDDKFHVFPWGWHRYVYLRSLVCLARPWHDVLIKTKINVSSSHRHCARKFFGSARTHPKLLTVALHEQKTD